MTTVTTAATSRSSSTAATGPNVPGSRPAASGGGFDQALLALMLGAGDAATTQDPASGDCGTTAEDEATIDGAATTDSALPLDAAAPWLAMLQAAQPTLAPRASEIAIDADALPKPVAGDGDSARTPVLRDTAPPWLSFRRTADAPATDADRIATDANDAASTRRAAAGRGKDSATNFITGTSPTTEVGASWSHWQDAANDTGTNIAPTIAGMAPAPAERERSAAPKLAELSLVASTPVGDAQALAPAKAPQAASELAPLAATPGTPQWDDAFAERVTLLVRAGRSEAEITLHPADLGPIEVRIRVEDGVASLQFDAARAETRQAIEDALPRLREMMDGGGLSLGQAQVGGDGRPGDDGSRRQPAFAGRAAGAPSGDVAPVAVRRIAVAVPGRVDTFA